MSNPISIQGRRVTPSGEWATHCLRSITHHSGTDTPIRRRVWCWQPATRKSIDHRSYKHSIILGVEVSNSSRPGCTR